MFLGYNLPRGTRMIPKECLFFQASFNSASTWQICPEPRGCASSLPAQAGGQRQSDSSSSRKWSSPKRRPREGYGDPKREEMQPAMSWNRRWASQRRRYLSQHRWDIFMLLEGGGAWEGLVVWERPAFNGRQWILWWFLWQDLDFNRKGRSILVSNCMCQFIKGKEEFLEKYYFYHQAN